MKNILTFQLGDTSVEAHLWQKKQNSKCFLINLHENESTSIEAGISIVEEFGGQFLHLHHEGSRNLRFKYQHKNLEIDPNRIFSKHGILKSLKDLNPALEDFGPALTSIEHFATLIKTQLSQNAYTQQQPLIALHNNQGDGEYTIHSLKNDDSIDKIHLSQTHFIYDFYYVLDQHHYNQLAEKDFHVALQKHYKNIHTSLHDGSLSLYFGERNLHYINIEAKIGHLDQQIKMIKQLIF